MTDGLRLAKFDCGVGDPVGLQEVPKWANGPELSPRSIAGTVVDVVTARQVYPGERVVKSTNFLVRTPDGRRVSFSSETVIREVEDMKDGRKRPVIYIRPKKND